MGASLEQFYFGISLAFNDRQQGAQLFGVVHTSPFGVQCYSQSLNAVIFGLSQNPFLSMWLDEQYIAQLQDMDNLSITIKGD